MMSKKMNRAMLATAFATIAVAGASATAQVLPEDPVLTGSYGWEDGTGTILDSFGNLVDPTNVAAENDIVPNTGARMLRVTEAPHSGTPEAHIAYVVGLEDGDVVAASVFLYDETPPATTGGFPNMRIWAHRSHSSDIEGIFSSIPAGQQNNNYTAGIGWEELGHEWTFDSNNGEFDTLVVQVRLYSTPATDPKGSTDFYIDDVSVEVYCASNPDLEIIFPNNTVFGDPEELIEPCVQVEPCGKPNAFTSFNWEDGVSTALGSTFSSSITLENTTEVVAAGSHGLKITESPNASGTPHIFLTQIKNLTDGDEVTAGFWTFDDTPGSGTDGWPSVRIWAHYTSGNSLSAQGQAGGNNTYSEGSGWEELTHSWTFDSNNNQRDGLVIQARVYSPDCEEKNPNDCSTDYFVDELWVDVCAADPDGVVFVLPDDEPKPKEPLCPDPNITSGYGWEDGDGTLIGSTLSSSITATNATDFVNSGNNAVKITESPHASGNPALYIARVRNLVDGDVVDASFFTFDDMPGIGSAGYPSVRIWARYTNGQSLASAGSIAQNLQNTEYSDGSGWQELGHAWVFDSNGGTRDGLLIEARIYSPNCEVEPCATDYYLDDVSINVCTANPGNILIEYADSYVFEPDPPIEVCEEPLTGFYGWEDGKGTYINASSSTISGTNIDRGDGPVLDTRALRITEAPKASSNPDVRVAFIENLQHGDVIRASFWTYDDTPPQGSTGYPSVRIWGRYGFTGEPFFLSGSAGGSDQWPAGTGWEQIEHVWQFDAGTGPIPRSALMVMVRVYSPSCDEESPHWDPKLQSCSTDFFIDDLLVEVCSDHPNVTITFPDGSIVGEPGEPNCFADVDGTGQIDVFDVWALNGAWGTADPNADVNGDGVVDGADLGIVLASFGSCQDFLFPIGGSATLTLEDTAVGGTTRQYDLYIELDPDEALVNVFNADITSSAGFESGSFVTIGTTNSSHFDIWEDANFDFPSFMSGTSMGMNAGWYNENPGNDLGLAGLYTDNRVLIASLLVDEETEFEAQLSVTYRDAFGRARQATRLIIEEPTGPGCPGDIDGNNTVNVFDLLALLGEWGTCPDPGNCPADIDGNGTVNVFDLLALLGAWGSCD